MSLFSLKKSERLCGEKNIQQVFESGKKGYAEPFRFFWLARGRVESDSVDVSVLFSVPKKLVKRATKRNRLKRRSREAYRLNKQLLIDVSSERVHIDIALIYNSKEILDYNIIENGVKKVLDKIRENI